MNSRKSTRTIYSIACAALGACLALASPAGIAQNVTDAPWVGNWANGEPCKGGFGTIGPFDYLKRDKFQGQLMVVEEHHFTEDVENLIRGATTEPMGDIDFVLRAWPNHHRALQSAVTFRLRHKKWPKKSKGLPAECYLQRAMKFSPRDPVPVVMLAHVMHKKGNPEEAIKAYQRAQELVPGDMVMKYNMGLAMTDAERWVQAREVAEEVYAADFPLPGLKNRLIRAGKWQQAVAEEATDTETAGAATDTEAAGEAEVAETGGVSAPEADESTGGAGSGIAVKDAGAEVETGDSKLAAEDTASGSKQKADTGQAQQQADKKQQASNKQQKQQQQANNKQQKQQQQAKTKKQPKQQQASRSADVQEKNGPQTAASDATAAAGQPANSEQASAGSEPAKPTQGNGKQQLTQEEKAAIAKANWEAKREKQRNIDWAKAMFKTDTAVTDEEDAAATPSSEPSASGDGGDTSSKARWMEALKQAESKADAPAAPDADAATQAE